MYNKHDIILVFADLANCLGELQTRIIVLPEFSELWTRVMAHILGKPRAQEATAVAATEYIFKIENLLFRALYLLVRTY